MRRTILAATVALAGLPALAQAQSYHVVVRGDVDQRSVEVYMGDLNLSIPRDAREASRRIDGAARYVCRSGDDRTLSDRADYRQCRYEAYEEAWLDLEEQAGGPISRGRVITRDVPAY
ncbi:MAG: UrcA family protein [Alphaproteobacteria bacterium]|jgi:UrcA family protein|nr:UrcA family protein [Alphaproteobacteria bacterium]